METHEINGERIEVPNLVLAAGAEAAQAYVSATAADRGPLLAKLQAAERARLEPPAASAPTPPPED